jgi:hypothetical protein
MGTHELGVNDGRVLSQALLEPQRADFAKDARRLALGLSLASIFGLALGVRFGAVSMAAHAVGVPLALGVVVVLGAPAFFVGALHGGIELDARTLVLLMARGVATAGFVLAGFSPAMALFSLSAESVVSVAALAALGLAAAGLLAQRATFHGLPEEIGFRRVRWFFFRWGFAVFAAALAGRVWWLVLPIVSEAR